MRSLEQTLAYQHPGVIEKLQSVYGVGEDEAADLFLEAKRWLWLAAKSEQDLSRGLDAPQRMLVTASLTMLDEAWHTFILFTRDYFEFCRDYLGRYIHHQPTTDQAADQAADHTMTDLGSTLRDMMAYVYDHLGADILIKWYSEYHDKYAGIEVQFTPTALVRVDADEPDAVAAQ